MHSISSHFFKYLYFRKKLLTKIYLYLLHFFFTIKLKIINYTESFK